MMKYVLALVVLLHLRDGLEAKSELTIEIRKGLKKLNELFGEHKLNISSRGTMLVPSSIMGAKARAPHCVGVFVRELKNLLKNVTVPENNRNTLEELEANLAKMGKLPEDDHNCKMNTSSPASMMPFQQYLRFLRNC